METSPSFSISSLVNDLLQRSLSGHGGEGGHPGDGTPVDEMPMIRSVLRDVLTVTMEHVEKRLHVYLQTCLELQQKGIIKPMKMKKSMTRMENYLMQKFHEKQPYIIGKDDKKHDAHRRALKNCNSSLVRDLLLTSTSVLDRLFQDDVMSVTDKDSIIAKGTKRSQNEEFCRYIEGRITHEEFHRSLVPAINAEHPHLGSKLMKEYDVLDDTFEDSICATCRVMKDVQVKRLATPLLTKDVISSSLHADLKSASITNSQKWHELETNKVAHSDIIDAMKTKYPDFYWALRKNKVLECFCGKEPDDISVVSGGFPVTATPTVTDKGDVANLDDVDQLLDMQQALSDLDEYPMDARPRGMCLIINNKDFQTDERTPRLTRREGSDIDVNRLKYIFSKLEFQVEVLSDLSDTELLSAVSKVANADHSPYNAFVCCIMSHCKKDYVFGSNCQGVRVSDLTAPFRASVCPSLAGKPKLFFIQGARGQTKMTGLNIDETCRHGDPVPTPKSQEAETIIYSRGDSSESPPKGAKVEPIEENIIPDEADFMVGYSTAPDHVSYRSRANGSWFIIKLAEVLERHGDRKDLLSCMLMVNEEVSRGNAYTNGGVFKQVPAPVFTLRKKVNLTSDPNWSKSLDRVASVVDEVQIL